MDKNVNIERDVTVGNNATIGGRVLVQADMRVKHNVRVDGWLDAPNIKGAGKGLFADEATLNSKYPNPEDGWWAIVGNTLPGEIFVAKDGAWVDTGNKGGEPTVDSEYLDSSVETLKKQVEALNETDEVLNNKIGDEATARTEADTAEATARKEADTAEATARAEADTALQNQLDSLIYPTISIGELDTLTSLPDTKHSRYVATYKRSGTTRVAGILDVFGDGWGHVTTQVLTSHCTLGDDGKLDTSGDSHTDNYVTQYYRSYSHGAPSIDKDTWTDWKPMNDRRFDELEEELTKLTSTSVPQFIDGVVTAVSELPATTGEVYYVHDGAEEEYLYTTRGTAGEGRNKLAMDEKTLYVVKSDESLNRWKSGEGLVQIAGDLLHTSDKGVADGVAPLDSNTQIPTKYIPDTFTDVVMLRGLYATAPSAQYMVGLPEHYYNTTDGKLYVIGTEADSTGAIKIVWEEETLSKDKLYCDVSTNSLYRYATPIAQIGGTGKLVAISVNADEEEKRVAAEKARAEAEAARVAAEAARVKAETAREDNEADRQSAETARVKAERSRTVAEGDRAEHEEERRTAEAKREDDFEIIKSTFAETAAKVDAAIASAEKATAAAEAATVGAEKVNAKLEGSVLTVTDRTGVEASLELMEFEEDVTVQVKSSVSGVSVSGLTLNVYENHGTTPTQYTTDSEGKVTFVVPHGSYYEVHFPDIAGCDPISAKGFTATIAQRTISVEYVEYSGLKEHVTVIATKHETGGAQSGFEGTTVTVQVTGGSTDTYTTDADGKVEFDVPIGKVFTVTIAKHDDYYCHGGYEHTFDALASDRTIRYDYYTYRAGVFVVGKDGNDYTADEWAASGLTSADARLIKVVTEELMEKGYPIMYNPHDLDTTLGTAQWCTQQVQFAEIPLNGNSTTADYYYDGKTASTRVLGEAEERGLEVPAFTKAAAYTVGDVAGTTATGYIGSVGQWVILNANIEECDTLAELAFGENALKLATWKTTNKWTSTQNNATNAYYFASQPSSYSKTLSYAVVPFYAF